MAVKQSFCYPLYRTEAMSFTELFKTARAMGYEATELWFRDDNFDELVNAARSNNLVIASMCGHGTLAEGMNNPDNHDRIETELRESIEIAAQLSIPSLICFSGNRLPGQSDDEGIQNTVSCLKRITADAEKHNINLNIELLNSKIDHPGYQCDHTAWGVEVCRQVASPRVKLLYDIYHMQIMEGDIIRTIENNIQHIGHFHTAGNPGRRDMDNEQELNYAAICTAISRTTYDGYIGHEFSPKGDKMDALRRAFDVCNQ